MHPLLLGVALGLWPGAAPSLGQVPEPPPPNVLLVVLDDVGAYDLDILGLGSDPALTPRLSALANEGLVFTNAVAEPNCSPSRAAILTGLRPHHSGVLSVNINSFSMDFEDVTIPEALPAEYETAAIGKWHLSSNSQGPSAPLIHGFDHAAIAWTNITDYYDFGKFVNGVQVPETEYVTTVQVDDALDWLVGRTEPWFCYLAFTAAHEPFQSPPSALVGGTGGVGGGPGTSLGQGRATYLQILQALDTEFGRLLDALDPEVLANTTILVVGDNGTPATVSAPEWSSSTSKGTVYQGGVHVPLWIAGRGVQAPGTCSALVEVNDLFATVLELTGADQPMGPDGQPAGGDSVSLVPYLENPTGPELRAHSFVHRWSPVSGSAGALFVERSALRRDAFKLLRQTAVTGPPTLSLFDLEADPLEINNLSNDPAFAAEVQELTHRMDAILASPGLSGSPSLIQVLEGGEQELLLHTNSGYGGALVWILGSMSAGSGTVLDGFELPIAADLYTWHTLVRPNSAPLYGGFSESGPDGFLRASWRIEAGRLAALAGTRLRHAALVFGSAGNLAWVSEPALLDLR